jgi:hypothetical protein
VLPTGSKPRVAIRSFMPHIIRSPRAEGVGQNSPGGAGWHRDAI